MSGYSDEKVERLTKEAVAGGFNHFKMKVGANRDADLRRGKIIRSVIDNPIHLPESLKKEPRSGLKVILTQKNDISPPITHLLELNRSCLVFFSNFANLLLVEALIWLLVLTLINQ